MVDATDISGFSTPSLSLSLHHLPLMSADATSRTSQRGQFIVLEGLDRCGKSTQVDRLVAGLIQSGRPARLQKFPGP